MRTRYFSFLVVPMLALLPMASLAHADEVTDLRETVDILNKKVAALEKKVNGGMQVSPGAGMVVTPEEPSGLVKSLQDINMGGHLDIQWNNNFRQPPTVAGGNIGRIFDTDNGSFTVNTAELWFENRAEEPGEGGYRINLAFGEDTGIVVADGLAGDKVDLQEAFVEYIAPLPFFEDSDILPHSLTIMAGRYATLAGFEVIEGPDNWNISRSFMFGLAIPFIHTGIRGNFQMFNDFFDIYFGVNNGWDVAVDNNTYKTIEVGLGYSPLEDVSIFHALYWGSENAGSPTGKQILLTNVVQYDVTDQLSLAADVDFGHVGEDNAGGSQDGNWYGIAGYLHYAFTEKFALTYRAEYFADEAGIRTGGLGLAGFGIVSDRNFGQTVTAEYKLTDQLIARAEFRHDKSNDDRPFGAGGDASQTSIGAQLLYLI